MQLYKPVHVQTISYHNPLDAESTNTLDKSVEAAIWVININNENINMDIEIEVLHMQGLKKHKEQLHQWNKAQGLKQQSENCWWKGNALVIVENNNLKRGVISLFYDSLTVGHPGIVKTTTNIA